jgi:hypothetical protein
MGWIVNAPKQSPSTWRRARRSSALVSALTALLLVLAPAAARADADPASDVLLIQNAFYPYQPQVPQKLEGALNTVLSATARAHLPLKVAIIGSPQDLGAVPDYYGHPQPYAEFLDREISFNKPQPLLVVMPAGFGLVATGHASALARVAIDTHNHTYGLTRTAILAVIALSRAYGHSIHVMPISPASSASHGGPPAAVLFSLPVALLIVGGAALARVRRRRGPRERPPAEPPPA